MKCSRHLAVVILAFSCAAFVKGQQDACTFDIECKDKGDDRCCSAYGFCGVGPDYCKIGCIYEDTELVGGDLPKRRGGGGTKTRTDDDCAIKCENTGGCKFYTYDIENSLCYLKDTKGLSREIAEKGKIISGSITNDGCETEPQCEPPAELINLQCIDVSGDTSGSAASTTDADKGPKRTYQGALEYCHVFEAALPYTVVTSQQLYARPMYDRTYGRFKRSSGRKGKAAFQITTPYGLLNLLQGENAPDLYGYETVEKIKRRVCNLTATTGDDVEVFGSSSDQDDDNECSARMESLIQQDPDDVELIAGLASWNLTNEEMNLLTSQDQTLTDQFPMLAGAGGGGAALGNFDRWHWLDTPARDDNQCLATIPGMVGKYRMFDCNADLRVICERRGQSPFPSQPPAIFNIPKKMTTLPTVPTRFDPQASTNAVASSSSVAFPQTSLQFNPAFQSVQRPNLVPQQQVATSSLGGSSPVGFQQNQFSVQQFQPVPNQQQQPVTARPSIYDPVTSRGPTLPRLPALTDGYYGGNSFGSFLETAVPAQQSQGYPGYPRYPRVNNFFDQQAELPKVNPFIQQHDRLTKQRNQLFGTSSFYKKK